MLALPIAVILVSAGAHVDRDALDRIRVPLENYLSRIESIHIRYVERWEPGREFARAENRRPQFKTPSTASPETARKIEELRQQAEQRGRPTTVTNHDLLDAFPSFRHISDKENTYANGETATEHREQYSHEGKLLTIDRGKQHAQTNAVGRAAIQLRSPLNALGYRLPMTLNMRLTELLQYSEVTETVGTEDVGNSSALVVRIGPNLPKAARIDPMGNDEMWYQLWLDPARQYLPLRIDIYVENQYQGKPGFGSGSGVAMQTIRGSDGSDHEFLRYRTEIQEFMDVRDLARNESVPFPRLASFEDGGGTIRWEISSAEINPAIAAKDFQPTIPENYVVTENGEIRRSRIQGGEKGRQQRFDEAAEKARAALSQSAPPKAAAAPSGRLWQIGVPVALVVVIALLLLLKSRNG